MSTNDHSEPAASAPYLGPLSALAARSFVSTDALIEAILALVSDQLKLRTSFLTHITPSENRNHIIASFNRPDGCAITANTDLPLDDTF